jgi:hypothetical protein
MNTEQQIAELERKVEELTKKVEPQIKPIMDTSVIKELEKNFFRFGHIWFDEGPGIIIPLPGSSIGNVVCVSGPFIAYIREGTISTVNEIFITGGGPGEECNYVVFLTPNVFSNL